MNQESLPMKFTRLIVQLKRFQIQSGNGREYQVTKIRALWKKMRTKF